MHANIHRHTKSTKRTCADVSSYNELHADYKNANTYTHTHTHAHTHTHTHTHTHMHTHSQTHIHIHT